MKLKEYIFFSLLIIFFAGCSGVEIKKQDYESVSSDKIPEIFRKIQKNSEKFSIAKCKINFSVSIVNNQKEKNYNARAICLWQPNEKIRMRISHILAGTMADILFDGENWYITDEQNAKVYVVKKIDTIRVAGFPKSFFEQMQQLPRTWLPPVKNGITLSKNETSYQILMKNKNESFEWIFPFDSALPSSMQINTVNSGKLVAVFERPETNITYNSKMFEPVLDGYKVVVP